MLGRYISALNIKENSTSMSKCSFNFLCLASIVYMMKLKCFRGMCKYYQLCCVGTKCIWVTTTVARYVTMLVKYTKYQLV